MAPQPQGAPRWDAQAQRWLWDAPAAGPASAPPPPQPVHDPQGPGYPQQPAHPAPERTQPGPTQPAFPPPAYAPSGPPPPAPFVPPGPPRPDGPSARWPTPATVGIAVAAVLIGGGVVWFVERGSGDGPADARPPAASAPASPSPGPGGNTDAGTPTPTPPAATASPSAGANGGAQETVRDPKGFTVAVPAGWAREDGGGGGVFYRSPDGTALLQVFRVAEPELSPLQAVRAASADLRARTGGYEEIRVGSVEGTGGTDTAELVYEYDHAESHGRRRGVERVLMAQDGTKWAVLAAGPAADWSTTQQNHAAALREFRPGG